MPALANPDDGSSFLLIVTGNRMPTVQLLSKAIAFPQLSTRHYTQNPVVEAPLFSELKPPASLGLSELQVFRLLKTLVDR
jgi:hypothetical protein